MSADHCQTPYRIMLPLIALFFTIISNEISRRLRTIPELENHVMKLGGLKISHLNSRSFVRRRMHEIDELEHQMSIPNKCCQNSGFNLQRHAVHCPSFVYCIETSSDRHSFHRLLICVTLIILGYLSGFHPHCVVSC